MGEIDRLIAVMDTTTPESITFFNWADYLDPELKERFRSETDIEVRQTSFDTNDDLLGKMKAGASDFDVIYPGGYIVSIMRITSLLRPLDISLIPSSCQIMPELRKPVFGDEADGNKYSVPYMFWTAGIEVCTDKVSEPVTSWATMWDPKWERQLTMLSAERTVFGEALKFLAKADVAAQNSVWIGYQTPNNEAFAMMNDPVIAELRPTSEQWAAGEIVDDLAGFNAYYTNAWTQVKST